MGVPSSLRNESRRPTGESTGEVRPLSTRVTALESTGSQPPPLKRKDPWRDTVGEEWFDKRRPGGSGGTPAGMDNDGGGDDANERFGGAPLG